MQSIENIQRAFAAEFALRTFAEVHGETDHIGQLGSLTEQNLIDLLANLYHFCDLQGIQMKNCLRIAEMHYTEEQGQH